MPQFLVIAHDGTDEGAPARRLAARPTHLASLSPHVEAGRIVAGGALLDDVGGMIGSVVMTEFDNRAALDAWLAGDPYVTGQVWKTVEIRPIRLAIPGRG